MSVNISDVVVKTPEGDDKQLATYNSQVLLIVNVASRCGFTQQYAGLQALQDNYGAQGFQVLASLQ